MRTLLLALCLLSLLSCKEKNNAEARDEKLIPEKPLALYIDVHELEPGQVTMADVEDAHIRDLATQGKYNVSFLKFWVDEQKGKVYCLSQAPDAASIETTHGEAHGLIPSQVFQVKDGLEAAPLGDKTLYLDIHELGAGQVKAADVAHAHEKDLAVQNKYAVNFINYWVDESNGRVLCLSEAMDSNAVIKTHAEAHGLLPAYVLQVKQGE